MSERLLYEDGVQVSLTYASELMQNLINNQIRNATRLITLTPGFFTDSFEPMGLDKSPSEPTTFYIRLKAGSAIFPNGEIFSGEGYFCRVPIERKDGPQYIKLVHETLKRTEQQYIFNKNGHYAESIDGARLVVSDDGTQSEDGSDLLVAMVLYTPDIVMPEVTDIRDMWTFYWSGAQVVDSSAAVSIADIEEIFSNDLRATSNSNIAISGVSSEISLITIPSMAFDALTHAIDTHIECSDSNLMKILHRFMPPMTTVLLEEKLPLRLPPGLPCLLKIRKQDAYRSDVASEWTDEETFVSGGLTTTFTRHFEYNLYESRPFIGLRIWAEELPDNDRNYFLKLWLSHSSIENTANVKADFELPFISGEATGADIPYFLFNYTAGQENLYCYYQIIGPNQRIVHEALEIIDLKETGNLLGDAQPLILSLGCDRMYNASGTLFIWKRKPLASPPDIDPNGSRYSIDGDNFHFLRFYIPKSPEREGDMADVAAKRYLSELEFANFVPAPLATLLSWNSIDAWAAAPGLPGVVSFTHSSKPQVFAGYFAPGDDLIVSYSDNYWDYPNGKYTVVQENPPASGIFEVARVHSAGIPGQCHISPVNLPRASILIYDLTDPTTAPYEFTNTKGSCDFEIGAKEFDAMATAPIVNGCIESPFRTNWVPDDEYIEDYVFMEGHWYEIRAYHTDGENEEYMDIVGWIKLWFKKIVSL